MSQSSCSFYHISHEFDLHVHFFYFSKQVYVGWGRVGKRIDKIFTAQVVFTTDRSKAVFLVLLVLCRAMWLLLILFCFMPVCLIIMIGES